MLTLNLDRFAGEGVIFENAFSCAATCVSSLAAFYTGLYPHNTGIYAFYRSSGRLHWLNRLGESGYHCVSIGKVHLPPQGFHERIGEQGNKYQPMLDGEPCETHNLWHEQNARPLQEQLTAQLLD